MRKRFLVTGALVACLAVPATAFAGEPTEKDKTNAAKECKAERGDTDATREAFAAKYGTNKNGKNAFGKCVSSRAKDEQAERKAAKRSASKDCREERGDTDGTREAFREKYGTNKNHRNAFGKCVSQHAKKKMKAADRSDRKEIKETHNAAKECAEERGDTDATREAFAAKYGTNKNDKNAFGKCVSSNVRSS